MANKLAQFIVGLTYTGPQGEDITAPTFACNAAYQSQNVGSIDVGAAALAGDSVAVPFGPVAGATAVMLINKTFHDVSFKVNGDGEFTIKTGGSVCITSSALPSDGSYQTLVSVQVTLMVDQVTAGSIAYYVFGDPT